MSNTILDPRDPDYCPTCGGECVADCASEPDPEREGQNRYIADLDHEDDTMHTCSRCGETMLYWQQDAHEERCLEPRRVIRLIVLTSGAIRLMFDRIPLHYTYDSWAHYFAAGLTAYADTDVIHIQKGNL